MPDPHRLPIHDPNRVLKHHRLLESHVISNQSAYAVILDVRSGPQELHADASGVKFGDRSIKWADAEWVTYNVVGPIRVRGAVLTYQRYTARFEIGRWPQRGESMRDAKEPALQVTYSWLRDTQDVNSARWPWECLVNLSRLHLEPRLIEELFTALRGGADRVRVNDRLEMGADCFYVGRRARQLRFSEMGLKDTEESIVILAERRLLGRVRIAKRMPNAVLIPRIYESVTTAEDRTRAIQMGWPEQVLRLAGCLLCILAMVGVIAAIVLIVSNIP